MEPSIEFGNARLIILNLIIAVMIYGAALDTRPADFRRLLEVPAASLAGLGAQFLLLPALTCLATWAAAVPAPLALAMILVACCPSGNFSNVLTGLARANVALSVSLTAASSLLAILLTPLNFAFYGWLNPHTRELTTAVTIDHLHLLGILVLVLGLPVALAMVTRRHLPGLADRLQRPMRIGSVLMLTLFIAVAFTLNAPIVAQHGGDIVILATLHNTSALLLGAAIGAAAGLAAADRRAVTMEVGVQNTGLGLLILFSYYPDAAEMIVLTAFWGVPHLVTGLGLAWWWARPQPV